MSNELKTMVKKVNDPERIKKMKERILKGNPELDSYNAFVDKIGARAMGPIASKLGKNLTKAELAEIEGLRPSKEATQRIMRKFGASPGKVRAVTGEAMSRGGEVDVVDLTTEMVIDE